MANKPNEANFFPDVPVYPSMGTFQPVYGKFDLTTYIQGASDYEIMAFLVGKYNACLEAYGNITKLSTDTITACKQLQDWINSWFDNLDVQEELNKKIDSMVEDGSFADVLKPLVQDFSSPVFVDSVDKMTDHAKIYVLSSNGHIYQWNGSQFVDTGAVYSQADNVLTAINTIAGSNITLDFNSLNFNTYVSINLYGTNNISNAPMMPFINGECLTLGGAEGNNYGGRQVYITEEGTIYIRTWNNSAWNDWHNESSLIVGNTIAGSDITLDFNSLQFNTYTSINLYGTNSIANPPITPLINGECITLGSSSKNNFAGRQVYITELGDIYIRTWSGSAWSDWHSGSSLIIGDIVAGTGITLDFNSLPFNTYISINLYGTNSITNPPMTPLINGECITLGSSGKNNFAGRQVYITELGDIYIRTWSGSAWSDWHGGLQTDTIINVGANYSIKTIREAAAKANANTTVYVHGGIYDLVAEGVDTSTVGLYFSGTWIGIGLPVIKAELDAPNSTFSVLNASTDFFSLNGFKIVAHNCRYCVHDEMGGSADRSVTHEYNNCTMTTDTQITSTWSSPRCIGSGLGGNVQLIVKNCYFDSIITTPCDFHSDWKAQIAPAYVIFTNNYINNGTVSFTNVHSDDDKTLLVAQISNNSLTSNPIIDTDFTARSWNNNVR